MQSTPPAAEGALRAAAPDLPPLELNALTLGPLLRLLLAQHGLEADMLPPDDAWHVFRIFARLPCPGLRDVCSFQATRRSEDDEPPLVPYLYCTLSRELATEAGEGLRATQIQWGVDLDKDEDVEEVELWSDDFDDLEAFFARVEEAPAFGALLRLGGLSEVFDVYLDQTGRETE